MGINDLKSAIFDGFNGVSSALVRETGTVFGAGLLIAATGLEIGSGGIQKLGAVLMAAASGAVAEVIGSAVVNAGSSMPIDLSR